MQNYTASKRPIIKLPITPTEIILELTGTMALLTMLFVLIKYWSILPATIPTHFGFSGNPDGWGGKESLLFLPILGMLLYVCMGLLSRYPHTFNYPVPITEENAPVQYLLGRKIINWLRTFVVILFGYLEWVSIQTALGNLSGLGPWFIAIILIVTFIPIVSYVINARRQYHKSIYKKG